MNLAGNDRNIIGTHYSPRTPLLQHVLISDKATKSSQHQGDMSTGRPTQSQYDRLHWQFENHCLKSATVIRSSTLDFGHTWRGCARCRYWVITHHASIRLTAALRRELRKTPVFRQANKMNVLSGGAKIKLEREVKCWIGRCEEAEELGQVGGCCTGSRGCADQQLLNHASSLPYSMSSPFPSVHCQNRSLCVTCSY
jgi:hypothetical protein